MEDRPEPSRRLPTGARTLWRLEATVRWGGAAVGAVVALSSLGDAVPGWVDGLVAIAVVLGAVVGIGVLPELRWRRWRYEIRDEEIDLRRGALTVVRTLIPVARIQHVETSRGVVEQSMDLATVVLHTAAGTTEIPALPDGEAIDIRNRIARLTRTPDEL